MHSKFKIVSAIIAGTALGVAATQGLHAQTKQRAFLITETELIDAAASATYTPLVEAAIQAAGGRRLGTQGGRIVAFVGEAPKRVGISEWESLEKAQEFRNSAAYKNLAPQRDKAVKSVRAYAIEVAPK